MTPAGSDATLPFALASIRLSGCSDRDLFLSFDPGPVDLFHLSAAYVPPPHPYV